jgi:hypothetical protein
MPGVNLGGVLATKYNILGMHGEAALQEAIAANRQAGVQESIAPSVSSRNFAEGNAALGNATSGRISATSRANLEGITGSLLPGQAAAENASRYGQAAESQARAARLGGLSPLDEDTLGALHTHLNNQQLDTTPSSAAAPRPAAAPASGLSTFFGIHNLGVGLDGAVPSASAATALPSVDSSTSTALPTVEYGDGHAKGIAKIPGKGDGTVDKVPAMLAPGEAVLNAGAAEHFGRHNIAALNAVGQAKMQAGKGAPPPTKAAPAKPQTFAGGTHMVGHGKSAKTPKIDPGVIQALMSMGQGGGGAPPMGGAPMMPQAPGMVPPGR